MTKNGRIYKQLSRNMRLAVLLIGMLFIALVTVSTYALVTELQVRAQGPETTEETTSMPIAAPSINLALSEGEPGTLLTVTGQGWQPGDTILISLDDPTDDQGPTAIFASAAVSEEGTFVTWFNYPVEGRWAKLTATLVVAESPANAQRAEVSFRVLRTATPETPTTEPVATLEPTPEPMQTPTVVTTETDTWPPMATITTASLNVRSGPGTQYTILAVVTRGTTVTVLGQNQVGNWLFVRLPNQTEGWVSRIYTDFTDSAPIVAVPELPAPTSVPAPTPTPPPTITHWRGEYFANRNLSGNPDLVRNDVDVNFDWGTGSPGANIPADNFSARWTRDLYFDSGLYYFRALVDDGMRLYVDNTLVLDAWYDSSLRDVTNSITLGAGYHTVRVEYYEGGVYAQIRIWWDGEISYPDWKAEYWSNRSLSGSPVLVRNDYNLDFNWGGGSPASVVPGDNFSARWTRNADFKDATYRFHVAADDAVRVWVDDNLIVDMWLDGEFREEATDIELSSGSHRVRVEYYERYGDARVRVWWERISDGSYPDWKAEYFDNRRLRDDPVLVRNETDIDHSWGTGSPGSSVPADNFSARWTDDIRFRSGVYRFRARADDGVRIWLDDDLILERWEDGDARWIEVEVNVEGGTYEVKVEYYEHWGNAEIEVEWERLESLPDQPPVAVLDSTYTVMEGGLTPFDAGRSYDPDGSIIGFAWDFDYADGIFNTDATDRVSSVRFPDGPATAVIALRITDDDGLSDITTAQVLVKNVAPTVEVGGPYAGQVDAPIAMVGTATDPSSIDQVGLTYLWDFGDGSQGQGSAVTHTYAQAGGYAVTLTVTDKDGAQSSDATTVQVSAVANQSPLAVISGPTEGLVGEVLAFSGDNSTDSDGTIVSYAWEFGDGTTATSADVTHSYSAAGDYKVTLTVIDNGGLSGTAKQTVIIDAPVVNEPPVAAINGPTIGLVDEVLDFSGSSSTDDVTIVSYAWEFGDGGTADGINVSHSYSAAGSYEVSLTVTDDGGLTNTVTQTVVIEAPVVNEPPVAVIDGPKGGMTDEALPFSGSSSTDDGTIVSYAWTFGDGGMADGINVSHSYSAAGSYEVSLTVTDVGGLSSTASHSVKILQPVSNEPPQAVINAPTMGITLETLVFDGSGSGDNDGTIVRYAWEFGDGQVAKGVQVNHAYAGVGDYEVSLTVMDDGGLTDTATHHLVIEPPPAPLLE